MDRCNAELCINWTGSGCICAVMGLDKDEAQHNEAPEESVTLVCDMCASPAEFELDIEDNQTLTPRACVKCMGWVCRAALENWGEHGVICLMSATEE